MGIQNFHKWLTSKYPQSQIDISTIKNKHEHLYIDMNFLLHYCSYGISIDDEKTLLFIDPLQSLMLANPFLI